MKVSRPVAFLAIVSAILLFGLLFPLSSMAGDRIKREFAGTYLWVEDGGFQRVVTITRDGTFSSVSQAGPTFGFSDGLGSAKRTGKREVTATQIDFNFDAEGNITGVTRVVFVMEFEDKERGRFQVVYGSLVGETFPPEENPLDPAGAPTGTFSFDYEGSRVSAD